MTGQTLNDEKADDISKANTDDMSAYALAITYEGGVSAVVKAIEPKKVADEDDSGSMA